MCPVAVSDPRPQSAPAHTTRTPCPTLLTCPPVSRPAPPPCSLQTLKAAKPGVEGPCQDIDWKTKEQYLSDADFETVSEH